jgi:FkbM family methyltransferase
MLRMFHHYAHALETRFFQLHELRMLRRQGVRFDKRFYRDVLRSPGRTEDWVNLARFLRPSEKVLLIDIGANVGDFTAEFLEIYREGKSVCFEPVQSTFELLSQRLSPDDRVRLNRCALSDVDGTGVIFLHSDNTLCTLAEYTEEANTFYKTVTQPSEDTLCKRLDNFVFDKAGAKLLVKIDVQGFELEVIRGGVNTLKMADIVLLECSFANEYTGKEPSFAPSCAMLKDCGLYPVVFQDYGRSLSNYAFERDVIFVKRALLDRIWFRTSDTGDHVS